MQHHEYTPLPHFPLRLRPLRFLSLPYYPTHPYILLKMVYYRLEPEDAYAMYDPTHSGAVPESVFRRGLADAFRMPFTEAQLDELSDRYRVGVNKARGTAPNHLLRILPFVS